MGIYDPDTHVEGGGLPDNVEAVFEKLRFVMFDYDGKIKKAIPTLKVDYVIPDSDETWLPQHYSCGSAGEPNKNGTGLVGIDSVRTSTNFHKFMKSLKDAGLSPEYFQRLEAENDISILDGIKVVVYQETTGTKRTFKRKDGTTGEGDKTIMLVKKIVSLPGDNAKSSDSGADAVDDDFIVAAIIELLEKKGKPVMKAVLMNGLKTSGKYTPEQLTAIKAQVVRKGWLEDRAEDGCWLFEDSKLSLPE